jgi:hypothetical protein
MRGKLENACFYRFVVSEKFNSSHGASAFKDERDSLNFCDPKETRFYWSFLMQKIGHNNFRVSRWPELNRRPTPYHGVALPAELHRQQE